MVDKAPINAEDPADDEPDLGAVKVAKFDEMLNDLAVSILQQALKLPKSRIDTRLDAFKAATAYKSVLNRAPDEDDGAGIKELQDSLLEEAPEEPEGPEAQQPETPETPAEQPQGGQQ